MNKSARRKVYSLMDSAEKPPIREKSGRAKSLTVPRTLIVGHLQAKIFGINFCGRLFSKILMHARPNWRALKAMIKAELEARRKV